MKTHILFVCLGNICRSPVAMGIAEAQIMQQGLTDSISVDACGTAAFNIGKAPDPRAAHAAANAGYDISEQRARQITDQDFEQADYIIAMDRINLTNITAWAPKDFSGEINLLKHYSGKGGNMQIADPYHEGTEAFDGMISQVETGVSALIDYIKRQQS